jgi:hypothetical protein
MRRLAMTGRTHRARATVGGSAACHGTAWRGQAKRSGDGSTHRASERVRGSGRGAARQGREWPCAAVRGRDLLGFSHRIRSRVRQRGAVTAMQCKAQRGADKKSKHAALLRERGSLHVSAWLCRTMWGWALRGKHTAAHEPLQFAGPGWDGRGKARRGVAQSSG